MPGVKIRILCCVCASLLFLGGCAYYGGDVPTVYISDGTAVFYEGSSKSALDIVNAFYSTSYSEPEPEEPEPEEPERSADTADALASEQSGETMSGTHAEPADIPYSKEGTVYWVKNGEVWHISEECPSLKRSENIRSGSIENAILAGKARACKKCGN